MACRFRARHRRDPLSRDADPTAPEALSPADPRGDLTNRAAAHGRPRRLALRLSLCVVVAVVVTAFGSTLWLGRLARQTLLDTHTRSAEVLTQTLAASLARQLDGQWSGSAQAVVDSVELDPRTAFVHVSDVHGRPLYQRIVDDAAWVAYREQAEARPGEEVGRPVHLDGEAPIIAQRLPVWNPPLRVTADQPTADSADRELVGFVTLGLTDRSMGAVLVELRAAQLVVALVACVVLLPGVLLLFMRWLAPLRRLTEAVGELSEGRRPAPVPDRGKDELGLLGRAFNAMVDRLFAAHAELERANQHLEGEVARRTAQLQAANQRLEAEIRDKDDFLRAVTHDLGAPVRNISGLASMISAKYANALADDALRKLDRINANARHQTELIHDLLELSRIRTRPGKRERFALQGVLDQLRDAFDYDLDHAGITLDIQGSMPTLFAERNRVRQVFQNLLDNAVKYMLDAATRLITIEHHEDEHHHFFAVADTGRGIAEEDLKDVFQVFRRASHSGTDRVAGKGVGLASVKSIVEAYGGSIHVSSKLGEGTRFDFTFAKSAVRADSQPPADLDAAEPREAGSSAA